MVTVDPSSGAAIEKAFKGLEEGGNLLISTRRINRMVVVQAVAKWNGKHRGRVDPIFYKTRREWV